MNCLCSYNLIKTVKDLLLLVDLQEDFLTDESLRPHRNLVEASSVSLLRNARARHCHIAHIRMRVSAEPDDRMLHWQAEGRWSCLINSAGAEVPAMLQELPGEAVFHKTGFSGYVETGLEAWMQTIEVSRVLIAGVHSHTCVRQTALDAYQRGYRVVVCASAVGTNSPFEAAQTQLYLSARGIHYLAEDAVWHDQKSIRSAPGCSHSLVDLAIKAVKRAAIPSLLSERIERVEQLVKIIHDESEVLSQMIVESVGKPIQMARQEVERSIDLVEVIIKRVRAEALYISQIEGDLRFIPRGLIAIVTPWNNPLAIPIGQLIPALIYNNKVLLKPSPLTLNIAQKLCDCIKQAGWPKDYFQIVEGGGDIGLALVSHQSVDAVAFTGSYDAGQLVAAACHRHACELQNELGGNNGAIVWQPAGCSIDVVQQVVHSAFGFAGQRCTAVRRLIVPAQEIDEWVNALVDVTRSLKWGDPRLEDTELGPVISVNKARQLNGIVGRARNEGHALYQPLGSIASTSTGSIAAERFFSPVLIVVSDPGAEVVREESFGPVLVIQPADSFDEALRLLNGVEQGLSACLVGGSAEEQARFMDEAEAGILHLDAVHSGAGVDLPFSGWKASGSGLPQHGIANRWFYNKIQAIYKKGDSK